jgi:hypothetical protein
MSMGVQNLETAERGEALMLVHDQCRIVLRGLDELGLHQAAAHVSMALDVMQRSFPHLAREE